jgi:hypothetical protein
VEKKYSTQTVTTDGRPHTRVEIHNGDSFNLPILPTELIMDILDYLSFGELLFIARLVNRLWNVLALKQARVLATQWISTVRHAIPGNVEVDYNGQQRAYQTHAPSRYQYTPPEADVTENGTISMGLKACTWGARDEPDPNGDIRKYSFPIVKSAEIYLTPGEEFSKSTLERSGRPRLCVRFERCSHTHLKHYYELSDKQQFYLTLIEQPLQVRNVWMEVGGLSEWRTKKVNLTQIMLEEFEIDITLTGEVRRGGPGRRFPNQSRNERRKIYSSLNGYEATLQIKPVPKELAETEFNISRFEQYS